MKCTVAKKDLMHLLDRCKVATDSKHENLACQCVLLKAIGETLCAFTSNLHLNMYAETQCAVETPGTAAVNFEKIRNAVRAMPDGLVTLKTDPAKHSTTISCSARRKYTIHGLNPEHFPVRESAPEKLEWYVLPAKLCKEALTRTKPTMQTESTMTHMTGVMLEFKPTELKAIAANTYGMAIFDHAAGFDHTDGAVFIPGTIIGSLTATTEESVLFAYTDRAVFVRMGSELLTALLPSTPFPNWRIIKEQAPQTERCKVDIGQLIEALKSVTAVTKGDIELRLCDCTLSLKLLNVPDAEGEDAISATADEKAEFVVVMHPENIMAILEGVGGGIGSLMYDGDSFSTFVIVGDDGFWGCFSPVHR